MAAFYRYVCHWQNCGKRCMSLYDLIDHVELLHIEKDPSILEKQEASQPPHIALSYVNCFFSEAARGISRKINHDGGSDKKSSIGGNKSSGSSRMSAGHPFDISDNMFDDDGSLSDVGSDDSSQSWATNASHDNMAAEHYLSRLGMTHGANVVGGGDGDENKKRFVCPVPGCGKRYKNVNGIKYHTKHGHRKGSEEAKKSYKCHCGKCYKSQSGLRHHQNTQHGNKQQSNANNKATGGIGQGSSSAQLAAAANAIAPPAIFSQSNGISGS